jgi:hypothetical protein
MRRPKRNSNKKQFIAVEWCQTSNEENKTNNGVKNIPCSKHSIEAHVHNITRPSLLPAKTHPLELKEITNKPLSQLPAWDIPPMIDIVLSPDSGSSTIPEDYIEDPEEACERYPDWNTTTSEGSLSKVETDDTIGSAVSWNFEEYGRRFYKLTRNFLSREDGRPESSISTTSNSSSVVTVVENPLA